MSWVLNCCYLLLVTVTSPLLLWRAITQGKYRHGWGAKLCGAAPVLPPGPRIWFHAVSVGEVQLLGTIISQLTRQRPEVDLVISSTTASGFRLAQQRYPQLTVFYCPLDFSWSVRRALDRVAPTLLVLAELEIWPNLIAAAAERVPIAVVNGRLSPRSAAGYRRVRWLLAKTFRQLDWVGAQDATSAIRFQSVGVHPQAITETGSLKFDGAELDRNNERTLELVRLAKIQADDIIWLVGSTQAPEEEIALRVFDRIADRYPNLKLILVPRHPERFDEVAVAASRSRFNAQRRTQLGTAVAAAPPRVLVVDTIGELGAWWGAAHIGFVGGSLTPRGGQNMIEPAAYGVATCFGPNTRNFRDIVELLLSDQAAAVVRDEAELERFVLRCLTDSRYRHALGQRAARLCRAHRGATANTVQKLLQLLPESDFAERSPIASGRHVA